MFCFVYVDDYIRVSSFCQAIFQIFLDEGAFFHILQAYSLIGMVSPSLKE